MLKGNKMGGYPIRAKLISYFKDHPGEWLYATSIAQDLREDDDRVTIGLAKLYSSEQLPGLEKEKKGGPYIYKPNSKPNITVFEKRGVAKNGDLILESDEGRLYRAMEL